MELDAKSDLFSGLVIAILAGAGLLWLVPAQIAVSDTGMYDLSPRLVPRLLLGLMLVLGLGVSWRGWVARRDRAAEPPAPLDAHGRPRSAAMELGFDMAVWIGASWLVVVLMGRIGFVSTAIPLLAGWLLFAGARPLWLVAVVSVVLPITLEELCWYALTIRLP